MKKITSILLISVFSFAAFSQGKYLEFKLSSSEQKGAVTGSMKLYYQNDNNRMEINMQAPSLPSGSMALTMLMLGSAPKTVYMIDDTKKTYSEFSTDQSNDYKDYPQNQYEVTVIGKEKVNGYNATHVKIKVNGNPDEQEWWTSKDVTDYASFQKIKSKFTGKENLYKALEAAGAGGFPVRVLTSERGRTMQMDLVKAESKNNPASLFSLDGYSKGEGMPGMPDPKAIREQLQNMTPEQRQQLMEQLKEKYQQPKN